MRNPVVGYPKSAIDHVHRGPLAPIRAEVFPDDFMLRRHWQIMKHGPSGQYTEGDSKTWRIEDVPEPVVDIALRAANLIGDGFYGVDLKESDKGVVVMEINDNPSIDSGVEDKCLGDELYRIIIQEFIRRLDIRKAVW